jgi:hypothetical protein
MFVYVHVELTLPVSANGSLQNYYLNNQLKGYSKSTVA